jgi:transposase-like protein
MREFLSVPVDVEITHPTCERCGAPMWLTRIEPDRPRHERRTFECKACGKTVVEWSADDN